MELLIEKLWGSDAKQRKKTVRFAEVEATVFEDDDHREDDDASVLSSLPVSSYTDNGGDDDLLPSLKQVVRTILKGDPKYDRRRKSTRMIPVNRRSSVRAIRRYAELQMEVSRLRNELAKLEVHVQEKQPKKEPPREAKDEPPPAAVANMSQREGKSKPPPAQHPASDSIGCKDFIGALTPDSDKAGKPPPPPASPPGRLGALRDRQRAREAAFRERFAVATGAATAADAYARRAAAPVVGSR